MENKLGSFTASDGRKLFFQSWTPPGKPQLVIALLHGLGEHSGRYEHWAEKFCGRSMAFTAFDLRGHGLSEGKRGSITSVGVVFDDIGLFLEKIESTFPGIPVVLYGNSLGGTLAVNFVLERKSSISALIITSPWFSLAEPLPGYGMALVRIAGFLWPSYNQSSGLKTKFLSRDKSVVEKYRSDPLVHDRISVRLFLANEACGERAISLAGNITEPVLVMHGTSDSIISPEGSIRFSNNSGNNVSLKLWEGLYHELHNEPEKDLVFDYVADWLRDKALIGPTLPGTEVN
jgi:alpha-beta hydrolase superfamily lysophospholipase